MIRSSPANSVTAVALRRFAETTVYPSVNQDYARSGEPRVRRDSPFNFGLGESSGYNLGPMDFGNLAYPVSGAAGYAPPATSAAFPESGWDWGAIGNTLMDFVPVVGPARSLYNRYDEGGMGNLMSMGGAMDAAFVGLDLFGLGGMAKMGVKGAGKLGSRLLGRVGASSGEIMNGASKLGPHIAGTFGGAITETVSKDATAAFRVFGGETPEVGRFLTGDLNAERLFNTDPSRYRWDFALPEGNAMTGGRWADIPAGIPHWTGATAPLGSQLGGGSQLFVNAFNPMWFRDLSLVEQAKFLPDTLKYLQYEYGLNRNALPALGGAMLGKMGASFPWGMSGEDGK